MSSSSKKRLKIVNLELTAICVAANKAGMSYGKFVSRLSSMEREAIIRDYVERIEEQNNDSFLNGDLRING